LFAPGAEVLDADFAAFDTPAPEIAAVETSAHETPRQPIDVVLRSFAADFQRFAEEWNGASA
jgi:hypothetical protein